MAQRGTQTIHVHLHGPFNVNVNIRQAPGPAVRGFIRFKRGARGMPGQINIDTTDEVATFEFVDRVGETTSAPAGATVTWSSDNEAVATVVPDSTDPLKGDVVPQSSGDCNVVAHVDGATEPDGTPFPDATAALHVDPGAAVGDRITLSD